MNKSDSKSVNNVSEISLKEVLVKISLLYKYVKSKWLVILIASLFGGAAGLAYSIFNKPQYTAVCTFVLEDAKGGGLGQYAGLASLAGINIGSGGGGGIFEGDNILELYKSREMIEKTLLSTCDFNGKKQLLIDRYINVYNLRNEWNNDKKIGNVNFNGNSDNFNRVQDSIITILADDFNKKCLDVTKPDKKLSIIRVEFVSKDELFSKYFTEKLVQTVNDFYVLTKTKKQYQDVKILQRQADSVRTVLNSSISGVALAIDAAPNANPQMTTLRVSSQKKQIDVQANSAIYGEVVKNLEISKISLRQETPLIQIIDKPVLPLNVKYVRKLMGIAIGFVSMGFVAVIIIVLRRFLAAVMK